MPQLPKDSALEVLFELHEEEKPDFSQTLLKKVYEVERQFQFDRDRELPFEHIRRLVEEEAANSLATDESRSIT